MIEWRDIAGYEGRYKVSNTGLVKSCEHYHPTTIKGTPVLRHRKEQLLKQFQLVLIQLDSCTIS